MKYKDWLDGVTTRNGRKVSREHVEIATRLARLWRNERNSIVHDQEELTSDIILTDVPLQVPDADNIAPNNLNRTTGATYVGRRMMEDQVVHRYSIVIGKVPTARGGEGEAQDGRATIVGKVESSFRFVDLLVPKRVSNEEIGDAVECINRMLMDPACKAWMIWLKVATTWFWIAINGVRNFTSAFRGKKAE